MGYDKCSAGYEIPEIRQINLGITKNYCPTDFLIIVYHLIIGNPMGANMITIAIWAMISNFDNNVYLSIYVRGRKSAI